MASRTCELNGKALPAYCPDLLARFCKETSLAKQEMLPDLGLRFCLIILTSPHIPAKEITRLDHMDIGARQENLAVRGEPIMLQLCVVPAYALTIHKVSVCSYARWSVEKTNLAPDASIVDQTPRHRLFRGGLRHGPGISWDESLGHSGVPAKQLRTVTNIDKTLGPEP